MKRRVPRSRPLLGPEALEGRAFLSATPFQPLGQARAAQIGSYFSVPRLGGVRIDPVAAQAILSALRGGPGNEFASTILRQVPNPMGIVRSFISGQRTEFVTRGAAFKVPKFQEAFNSGPRYDHLSILASGGILQQRGASFQFGAILLGPYDENATSQIVFGIDRGSGAGRPAVFPSRPALTPDALVTLTIGPYGREATGKVTDLISGVETPIDPAAIRIAGSTIRVIVPADALPSTGLPSSKYRFASWTHSGMGGGIETVGSFSPESSMTPVGVQGPLPRLRIRGR